MGIRVHKRFRTAVASVREEIRGRERRLFDLICFGANLAFQFPRPDINLKNLSGARDPRRSLARARSRLFGNGLRTTRADEWSRSGARLAIFLTRKLRARAAGVIPAGEKYDPLSVLLAYACGGLAVDCAVPRDPVLLAAWTTVVRVFATLLPSRVGTFRVDWLDRRALRVLNREAAAGRRRGRAASGLRPGRAGRILGLDPRLTALVQKSLGKRLVPSYEVRYVFYTRPGDYFWPHPDDEEDDANVFICLSHRVPRGSRRRSAFLAYRPDGSVERYELTPGTAVAAESAGLVHGREPVQPGERVTLLAVAMKTASKMRKEARAAARLGRPFPSP
jgi:hypothetical protein